VVLQFISGPWASYFKAGSTPSPVLPGESFEVSDQEGRAILADHPGSFRVLEPAPAAERAIEEPPKHRAIRSPRAKRG